MTYPQAFLGFVCGAAMVVVALVWLFGPWALLACGVLLAAASLLLPTRDAPEAQEQAAPPA